MEQQTKIIDANDRTVREVLDNIKYTVDFFQREFKWGKKQIEQLIADLETKFLSNYDESHERSDVQTYSCYYLGSIVVSLAGKDRSIIDGQQRLTSLTLLLIYLNNLQRDREDTVSKINDLVFSESYAVKSYNLQVEDRKECIEALYNGQEYDAIDKGESVRNIAERYKDIEELFPEELKDKALPYFIDWLIGNVIFVEIKTYSDDDAYTIFETMNDRGLNLTSAEMLKGYLLSNIATMEQKHVLNEIWKRNISKLKEIDKEEDLEFFKSWLRAKYAETIRPGKKGAANEDFEKIGTRFHNWARDNKRKIGLSSKKDFYDFINIKFEFYIKLYLKIHNAATTLQEGLEPIYYINERGFTLYFPILMAPVKLDDDEKTINKKLALVSRFLETFVVFRSVNYRTLSYSSIRYTMFSLVKELRDKRVPELVRILKSKIKLFEENLDGLKNFGMHKQNKRFVRFLLARITAHIEKKSGIASNFENYINPNLKKPFEVEHLWSVKFEEHRDEFEQRDEFEEYRNSLGALVLVPRGFNQSYGDLPYEKKLPHYFGQNLLAKTLNPQCYDKNPSFLEYKKESKLLFKSHPNFKKKDLLERQELYKKICEEIWNPKEYDTIATG